MKKILSLVSVMLVISMLLISCSFIGTQGNNDNSQAENQNDIWTNALYQNDIEIGEGAKTVQVEVKAGEKSVTFTIHTDKETLGDALLEHNLIAGEKGAYGLYIKLVNGIEADYDKDGTYWAFYKNGEMMMVGVDGAVIADGEHYELIKE